jgi:hypothetical protein
VQETEADLLAIKVLNECGFNLSKKDYKSLLKLIDEGPPSNLNKTPKLTDRVVENP